MPTESERHALLFLAAVAVIGTGARAVRSARVGKELSAAERLASPRNDSGAVGRQIGAVDSVRAGERSRAKPSRRRGAAGSSSGPGMPIPEREKALPGPPSPIDLNVATASEIERLPRIGPALAQRIIAWREAHGPFRSLDDLRHVRGIGPATAALLAESVTF